MGEVSKKRRSSSPAVLTPRVLEERGITLGDTLGRGIYSKVKIGTGTTGPVAVKVITIQRASHTSLQKRIPREIDCLRVLNHPNIIRYLLHVQTEYCVYIVMEFAEHGSVLDYMNKHHKIGEKQARRWFKQLLEAVEYCHGKGVVHRDIKCENILLGQDMRIKLGDFGFARNHMKVEGPQSETYCGSPIYSAPEILLEEPYTPHYSDVWSMGIVLFCILYNRLPFTDAGYRRIIRQEQCKVRFPPKVPVSTSCKGLIDKMIAPLRCRLYIPALKNHPWVLNGPPRQDSVASTSSSNNSSFAGIY